MKLTSKVDLAYWIDDVEYEYGGWVVPDGRVFRPEEIEAESEETKGDAE